jgi:rubrerythrin
MIMTHRLTSPLLILPFITVLLLSCKSEPDEPATPQATIENLKVAHAVAFRRAEYYAEAQKIAGDNRLGNLATLYAAIARSETIHAEGHETLLRQQNESIDTTKSAHLPLGSIQQVLKMGVSLEQTETQGIYPSMIRAAAAEEWPEAGDQFSNFMKADDQHSKLLIEAKDRRGILSISSFSVCTSCGYIGVDHQETDSCPVCTGTTWEKV